VTGLLPFVDHDAGPQELLHRDLRLAGPIRAHEADVLAGVQGPGLEEQFVPRRHRGDDVG
jgi:hypothetical protein